MAALWSLKSPQLDHHGYRHSHRCERSAGFVQINFIKKQFGTLCPKTPLTTLPVCRHLIGQPADGTGWLLLSYYFATFLRPSNVHHNSPCVKTPLHHHLAVVLALNWRGPMMERALAFPVASKALQLHLLNLFGRVKTSSQASSRILYFETMTQWRITMEAKYTDSVLLNDSWGRVKIGRNTGTRASHLSPTSSD